MIWIDSARRFLGADRSDPPLRRRPGAQRANPPDRIEIYDRACNRKDLHGDTNGLAVNGFEEVGAGCRSGKRRNADEEAKSTERHEGGAGTLQQDEEQAGEPDDPRAALACVLFRGVYRWFLLQQEPSPFAVATCF